MVLFDQNLVLPCWERCLFMEESRALEMFFYGTTPNAIGLTLGNCMWNCLQDNSTYIFILFSEEGTKVNVCQKQHHKRYNNLNIKLFP